MQDAARELSVFLQARITSFLQGDPNTVVSRWDDLKEEIRLKSWVIYREHRRNRQAAARTADDAARAARTALVMAPPASSAPLITAWSQASDAAREAWTTLTLSTLRAASILDHLFSNTSSYYFHSLARTE